MSDAIRNAVIKLGIEFSTPKMPDLSVLLKQQDAITKAQQANNVASRAAAASTNDLAAAQQKLAAATADRAAAQAKLMAIGPGNAGSAEAAIASNNALFRVIDAEAAVEAAAAKQTEKLADAKKRLHSANIHVGSSALGVAKGLAFVAAGESDALAKALPLIATFEGLHVVGKNLEKMHRALEAAQKAQAAAGILTESSALKAASAFTALAGKAALPLAGLVAGYQAAQWALDEMFGNAHRAIDALQQHASTAARQSVEDARSMIDAEKQRGQYMLDRVALLNTDIDKQNALLEMSRSQLDVEQQISSAREESSKLQAVANKLPHKNIDRADQLLERAKSNTLTSRDIKDTPDVLARARVESEGIASARAAAELPLQRQVDLAERELLIAQKQLDVLHHQSDERKAGIKDTLNILNIRKWDLEEAKKALKVDAEKSEAMRGAIGALKPGEKKKLLKAVEDAEKGMLTKKDAENLQKYGGDAGQSLAQSYYAKLPDPSRIKERLENLQGSLNAQKQQTVESSRDYKHKEKEIQNANDTIRQMQTNYDDIVATVKEKDKDFADLMRSQLDIIQSLLEEVKQMKTARGIR